MKGQSKGGLKIGKPLGDFFSAIVAFIALEALHPLFRGGTQFIPQRKVMAGYSTGLAHGGNIRLIVLPQALRNMAPPIVTPCVIIFQDAGCLAGPCHRAGGVSRRTSLVDARELRSLELHLFGGFVYLIFWFMGTIASRRRGTGQVQIRRLHH